MQFNVCPLDEIDFYKAGHYAQYPENTVEIYSNFTPRNSRSEMKKVIVMGVQMVLQDIHENWKKNFFNLTEEEILEKLEEYKEFMDASIYPGAVTIEHIMNVWKIGHLPLEVRAIPEGTLVDVGVPVLTIRNTHEDAYWLVNYLETKLSNALWKPITSATTAFQYLRKFHEYSDITGAEKEFIQFQGHDFSYRGMSGNEDSVASGLGHLTSFVGTDTVPAIKAAKYYGYGDWKKELIGCSVVATEHSVLCSCGVSYGEEIDEVEEEFDEVTQTWKIVDILKKSNKNMKQVRKRVASQQDKLKYGEFRTFERLLEKFPTNILSVVSDTWDYWRVITDYLPRLKDKVMARNGRLVIRPDSGDPVRIICGYRESEIWRINDEIYYNADWVVRKQTDPQTIYNYLSTESGKEQSKKYGFLLTETEVKGTFECLWDTFGGTVNDKGYRVLDTHIGLIYGDSITLKRQEEILQLLMEKGFTADNLILGIGSFTYEYVTRDTYGSNYALRALSFRNL